MTSRSRSSPRSRRSSSSHSSSSNGCRVRAPRLSLRECQALCKARKLPALLSAIQDAVSTIGQALDEYSIDKLALSFNAGKDSMVLLDLARLALQQRAVPLASLRLVHFPSPGEPFEEMVSFQRAVCAAYNVRVDSDFSSDFKKGVQQAILMGVRRSDPTGTKLATFQQTSPDWPRMMRVNPLLDWTYDQIWAYHQLVDVPFCSLYARGYTSIGTRGNTIANPALRRDSDTEQYKPAWLLPDHTLERAGRIRSAAAASAAASAAGGAAAAAAAADNASGAGNAGGGAKL